MMFKGISSLVRAVLGLTDDGPQMETGESTLLQEIDHAHREWRTALAYCDEVTDPADIDFAIYHLKSAQQRYVNLWQQAKQAGICAWDLPFQEIVLSQLAAANRAGSSTQPSAQDDCATAVNA